jgi:hypothetical protein
MPPFCYHRSKLSVYFRSCDICRSEADDTVSVDRAERLLVPSDVDQTVLQQRCVQISAQELLFYLSQKSFFLWCEFFVHIIPPISVPFLSAKRALDLVRENQQSSAHNFVKDFSSIFLKSSRRSPLKKGADSKNSLNMEKQRFKTPAIRDFIYGVTKEF